MFSGIFLDEPALTSIQVQPLNVEWDLHLVVVENNDMPRESNIAISTDGRY